MSVGAPQIRLGPQQPSSTNTVRKSPNFRKSSKSLLPFGDHHLHTGYISAILMKKLMNYLRQSHKIEQDIMGCMTV